MHGCPPVLRVGHAQDNTIQRAIDDAIDGAIRPGFLAFETRANMAANAVASLCAEPGQTALVVSRQAFDNLVVAWGQVEFIRLGPLSQENRLERVLFWPDPPGRGLQQIQAVITTGDETALSTETLAGKSVALQGLQALEFTLFGSGSDDLANGGSKKRCAYAEAIERGEIDTARLGRWRKLKAEEAFNSASIAERRNRDKAFGKMVRQVKKIKDQKGMGQ